MPNCTTTQKTPTVRSFMAKILTFWPLPWLWPSRLWLNSDPFLLGLCLGSGLLNLGLDSDPFFLGLCLNLCLGSGLLSLGLSFSLLNLCLGSGLILCLGLSFRLLNPTFHSSVCPLYFLLHNNPFL